MVVVLTPVAEVMTPRERSLVEAAKHLVGDIDPNCHYLNDMSLLCFLYFGIDDINAHPTETFWTLDQFPKNFEALLLLSMQLQCYVSSVLREASLQIELNDNGVVLSPPPIAEKLTELHGILLEKYEARKEIQKANIKPGGCGLGSTRVQGYGVTRFRQESMKRFGRLF